MLIVVGGARDAEARAAVDQLGRDRAALLDAADMSRPGWRLSPHAPRSGRVVAAGRAVAVEAIEAVLVRRLAVHPQELTHVHADDRDYVAAEMTALLAWWLCALAVPVLNRPAAGALCGPAWRPEQWCVFAARNGVPAIVMERSCSLALPPEPATAQAVVVGKRVLGDAPASVRQSARTLAKAAGLELMSAGFDAHGALVAASALPRLTPEIVGAIASEVGLA
jgi:hypothetical protein